MGNCVLLKLKGESSSRWRENNNMDVVKVVTEDGGILELFTPITAECVSGEFPGHAIFKTQTQTQTRGIFSQPLLHNDLLHPGQLYYLLPYNPTRLLSKPTPTPYRISTPAKNRDSDHRPPPNYSTRTGVWKVNLVITPQQLSQILSHHNRTEDLIDNLRTVAKCANGVGSTPSSDHSSVAGSWKASSSSSSSSS